jgi:hypothetical protein
MKCTRFKSLRNTKPEVVVSLTDVLTEIASEKYKSQIEEIRKFENPSKSPLKDKLPVFTPTGVFNYRSLAGLEEYIRNCWSLFLQILLLIVWNNLNSERNFCRILENTPETHINECRL